MQQRFLISLAVRVVAIAVILLIVRHAESDADDHRARRRRVLTVVLKDFCGRFPRMVRVDRVATACDGDWLEINGVSGEVIDVGPVQDGVAGEGYWPSDGPARKLHGTGRD